MYLRELQGYEQAPGSDQTLALETINNLINFYIDHGRLKEVEGIFLLQGKQSETRSEHVNDL